MASLTVSDEIHKKLEMFCVKNDKTMKDVTEEAVLNYLKTRV